MGPEFLLLLLPLSSCPPHLLPLTEVPLVPLSRMDLNAQAFVASSYPYPYPHPPHPLPRRLQGGWDPSDVRHRTCCLAFLLFSYAFAATVCVVDIVIDTHPDRRLTASYYRALIGSQAFVSICGGLTASVLMLQLRASILPPSTNDPLHDVGLHVFLTRMQFVSITIYASLCLPEYRKLFPRHLTLAHGYTLNRSRIAFAHVVMLCMSSTAAGLIALSL